MTSEGNPLEEVRRTSQWIMSQAKHVTIDGGALLELANSLCSTHNAFTPPKWSDFAEHYHDDNDADATAQYVMVVDTLNFCFWPQPSLEYAALAGGLKRLLVADPHALDADRLARVTEEELSHWVTPTMPELGERVRLLRECGRALARLYGGLAANMVRAARGSAAELVSLLTAAMPGFRDTAVYRGRQVYFLKRAQIFVGDIWGAFEGRGIGEFGDISRLTMFPDYRVPQLLHCRGVMRYSDRLDSAVRGCNEIAAGSEEECEIRAASVQSVERLSEEISKRTGRCVPPVVLDWALWNAGEELLSTLPPHHRTRTIFY